MKQTPGRRCYVICFVHTFTPLPAVLAHPFIPRVFSEFGICGGLGAVLGLRETRQPNKPGPLPSSPTEGHTYKPAEDPTFPRLGGIKAWVVLREGGSNSDWEGWGRLPRRSLFWAWGSNPCRGWWVSRCPSSRVRAAVASHAHACHKWVKSQASRPGGLVPDSLQISSVT